MYLGKSSPDIPIPISVLLEGIRMNNMWYLFIAYLVIWAALWGYMLWIGKKERRLSEELKRIKLDFGGKEPQNLSEDKHSG